MRAAAANGMIGRDLARRRPRALRTSGLATLVLAVGVSGLGLAALRVDNLRLRYALAEAVEQEKTLLEERSLWTARVTALRDPTRLEELARKRGLGRPERQLDLRPTAAVGRTGASRR